MALRRDKPARPSIADLVDLEMQLAGDESADRDRLRRRDAAIAEKIGAADMDGPRLYLAWLKEVRDDRTGEKPSPGRKVEQFVEVLGIVLCVLGLVTGAGTVAGWLAGDPDRPVNAAFFFGAVVGLQVLLLFAWCVAVLPATWLGRVPGIAQLQTLLRAIGRWLPVVFGWIGSRFSGENRQALSRLKGTIKGWDWIYGKVRFWVLVRLTQVFAVAFNVGAIAAFVAICLMSRPFFGWQSDMLDARQIHKVTHTVALPWSGYTESAVPTLEQIRATDYETVEERYIPKKRDLERRPKDREAGIKTSGAWRPFLLMSLIFYGLAPRVLTWVFCNWRVRRALNTIELSHREFQKLRERLMRPFIETQAVEQEPARETAPLPPAKKKVDFRSGAGPFSVIKWAGVDLDTERIDGLLRGRFGGGVSAVFSAGGLEDGGDEAALNSAAGTGSTETVVVLVEAWEPPVADYIDFLARLREKLGEGRPILVLLYNQDTDGRAVPPKPLDAEIWSGQLASAGDPWLRVEPMVEEADA